MNRFLNWFGGTKAGVQINIAVAVVMLAMTVLVDFAYVNAMIGFSIAAAWAWQCGWAEKKFEDRDEDEAFLHRLSELLREERGEQ